MNHRWDESPSGPEPDASPPVSAPAPPQVEAEAPPPPAMAPVAAGERIEILDVLRGVALFGILTANMRAFNAPGAAYGHIDLLHPGRADRLAQALIDVFVSAKFITLFSFLFGLGFAVQLGRAEARGARLGSFYPRRLLVLLAFGLLHGTLLWWGDILAAYALMGFALLAFRKRTPRALLRAAGGVWLLVLIVMTGLVVAAGVRGPQAPQAHPQREPAELQRVVQVYQDGRILPIARENLAVWTHYIGKDLVFTLAILPTFLFGLWVWRRGIVQDLESHHALLARTCALALPLGLGAAAFTVASIRLRPEPTPQDLWWLAMLVATYYGTPLLSLGYASGLALLALRPAWQARLRPFAAVGRMALTNYLMHSLVCVPFFIVTRLYGRVGPLLGLLPTLVLYAAQVAFSNWWLARYRFGPMEWLWRSLTYGRLGPLRREAAGAP